MIASLGHSGLKTFIIHYVAKLERIGLDMFWCYFISYMLNYVGVFRKWCVIWTRDLSWISGIVDIKVTRWNCLNNVWGIWLPRKLATNEMKGEKLYIQMSMSIRKLRHMQYVSSMKNRQISCTIPRCINSLLFFYIRNVLYGLLFMDMNEF